MGTVFNYSNSNCSHQFVMPTWTQIIMYSEFLADMVKGLNYVLSVGSDVNYFTLEVQKLFKSCPGHARSHQNFVVSLPIPFENLP